MFKHILITSLICASSTPAFAADLGPDPAGPARHNAGAFAGAQLRLSLGAKRPQASAGLALAPMSRSSRNDGQVRLLIGQGLNFGMVDGHAPTLNLAGKPLKQVVRAAQGQAEKEEKDGGISTVGWVGIGVGVLVVGAVVGYAILVSSIESE